MSIAWFDSVTITVECAFATAPLAVTPTWTDISAYVRRIDVQQGGRQNGLDQFQAGTATIELDNSDRRFDPLYTAGAYYPNVLPRKKIRVRVTYSAVTYDLWCGYVDGWPTTGEPSNHLGICTVTATDGFKMLSRQRLPIDPTNPVGDGETIAVRVGRLLDYAAWPAADRTLDTDSPLVGPLVPNGQTAMSEMYTAAGGDLGEIFITPDGKFTYRGHRWQLGHNLAASATFGDGGGAELPYQDVTLTFDDTQIFNRATASATVSGVSTAFDFSDATSITAYGESARDLGTVAVTNGNVVQNTVEWVVSHYKDAILRAEQVVVNPRRSASTLFPVVLAAQVGTRWTLVRRPQNVGSSISQDVIVQSVSHSIGLAEWQSTFTLAQSPSAAGVNYWILGTGTLAGTAVWA
jgi:hypothetical protein